MSDLWPGEAEIMEQHEWRMSEAPTAEILAPTREYPKAVFEPVIDDVPVVSDLRITITNNGNILFPVRWAVEYRDAYYGWSMCPSSTAPLGDSYGLQGFGWNADKCLRKAKRKANAILERRMKTSYSVLAV